MDKLELLGLFPQELGEALADMKLPAYRVKQLFSWLHRGARFEEMTNISKPLRETLAQNYADQPVSLLEQRVSKLDGTRKLLYALRDGNCVEGVLMHYHHGYTLCLSTQVGCRMAVPSVPARSMVACGASAPPKCWGRCTAPTV